MADEDEAPQGTDTASTSAASDPAPRPFIDTAPAPEPINAPPTIPPEELPPVTEPAPEANGVSWSGPRVDEETGIAYDGHGLPINRRLRSIALADAGRDEDPAGDVSPEDIAATAERLAAFDKAYPPLGSNPTTAELERRASAEEVDISGARTNEERASLILAARPART